MKLFEVFGEVALKGQAAVDAGLSQLDQKAAKSGASLTAFGERVGDSGKTLTKWVSGPILGAVTALGGLGVASAGTADRIAKASREVGLATDSYQELEFALSQIAGVATQEVDRALGRLNQRIGLAASGNDKYAEALVGLGFSMDEVASGSINTEQAFEKLTVRLQNTKTDAEAAGIASEILGTRIGRRLGPALRQGGDAVGELRQQFKDLGLGLSGEQLQAAEAFGDNLDLLKRQFSAVATQLGISFLPIMEQLIEVARTSIVPALQTVAGILTALFQAFGALPGPVQSVIGGFVGLAAVLGPMLIVAGKIFAIFGSITSAIPALVAAVTGITSAIGLTSAAVTTFLAIAAPVIGVVAGIAAAVAAAIIIFKNWDTIVAFLADTFQFLATAVQAGLSSAGNLIRAFVQNTIEVFKALPGAVLKFVTSMVTGVVNKVKNMVKSALSALKNLYDKAVGNSIIPDLATDVGKEMTSMADQGAAEANRFSNSVTSGLSQTQSPFGGSQAAASRSSGTNVDMRHSIIRDDKDMLNRMRRNGLEMTGAF